MNEVNWIERAAETSFEAYSYMSGERTASGGDSYLTKYAARNGQHIYSFGEGTVQEVDQAVALAKAAYLTSGWSERALHARRDVLLKLADLILENADELALYESMDVGKPIMAARNIDVPMAAEALRETAFAADKLEGASLVDGSVHTYQVRKPVGVVGAIVGWNYPLLLACQKIGPALMMGNSIVLKPSEFSSLSACRLAELAIEAELPPGLLNVVVGSGAIVGDALARHGDVRMLTFTGSSATGKRLQITAGESNMKRLLLECGGKSPFIVFDDYDGDLDALAVHIVSNTTFRNQGAVCVSSSRLLLQRGIREELLPKIIERTLLIQPGDPLAPETEFGAIINENHLGKTLSFVEAAKSEGAELLCGGDKSDIVPGGYYMTPAIFDNVAPYSRLAKEEVFGPVVSLFSFDTEDEALELANNSEYGLAAYAATSNANRMHRLGRSLEAGYVQLIGSLDIKPGGVSFGIEPMKQSGVGAEGGVAGLAPYTVCSHVSAMHN